MRNAVLLHTSITENRGALELELTDVVGHLLPSGLIYGFR